MFFKSKEDADKKAMREDFEDIVSQLRTAPELSQAGVGQGINMAFSFFEQRFGGVSEFQLLSTAEQIDYIKRLAEMEEKLGADNPHASIAYALFKMWVAAVSEKDDGLAKHFSTELAYFSIKGERLGSSGT